MSLHIKIAHQALSRIDQGNEKISKLPEQQDILEALDIETNYLFKKKKRKSQTYMKFLIYISGWNVRLT